MLKKVIAHGMAALILLTASPVNAATYNAQSAAKWKDTGAPRSYLDDIRYYQALDGKVQIVALGSSVTAGAGDNGRGGWVHLLSDYLKTSKGFKSLTLTKQGYGGFNTKEILDGKKVEAAIAKKPDIVLFETCLLNDYGENIPLEDSIKNIDTIVAKIKKALPKTEVILLSPNSTPKLDNGKNKLGLKLSDYITVSSKHIAEKKWNYIDIYKAFQSKDANNKDWFADGVHPNKAGYDLWFNIVKTEFEKKQ